MNPTEPSDPYRAQAGPELDAFIHTRVMNQTAPPGDSPEYSSQDKHAKRVLAALKAAGRASVITGRTDLEGRSWFARFETDAMDGTEVFADTFALAICRLALLRVAETELRKRS